MAFFELATVTTPTGSLLTKNLQTMQSKSEKMLTNFIYMKILDKIEDYIADYWEDESYLFIIAEED
jgi:hypothetical protein